MITATAIVTTAPEGTFEIRNITLKGMRSDEIIVRMVATGVCHTDFSCANGTIPVPSPIVLGHEGAGVVECVGSDVCHVQVGDHVILSFPACGVCASCCRGSPAYCKDGPRLSFGGTRLDGSTTFALEGGDSVYSLFGQSSFSSRSIVSGYCATSVDKSLPLKTLCPLGCSIQTGAGTVLNVLKPEVGSSIVIYGVGSVGLAGVMSAAKLTPAARIVAVDVSEEKLQAALKLGATHVINSSEQDVVKAVRDLTNGNGSDYAFDTTGNRKVIEAMIAASTNTAKVASVGSSPIGHFVNIEVASWIGRGISYSGACQGSAVPRVFLPALIEFWRQGRLPFDQLVTEYSYRDFERMHSDVRDGFCIKPVLLWD
ncbi:aryl-alcohol dehydrogenase [Fusarium oxysporum f. sp. albedinis]|nr:aryl-alcohol dehydrogenase [Fusarium oxysporum f. sp. albedinis]